MAFHILGDPDTILGFAFAGVPGTAVEDAVAARRAFVEVSDRAEVRILVVTRVVAAMLDEELTAHRLTSSAPFVVEIPDLWGREVKRATLVEMIQEAVGIRISRSEE